MKNQRYILSGNEPQACEDIVEWAMWMGESNHQIARDEIGDICVSTAFIGIASGEVKGVPLLFETMVFPSNSVRRYTTYQQAIAGHSQILHDLSII
jgi:hypothetical protein